MDPSIMLLTLKSSAKLNNGVEIPYLGLSLPITARRNYSACSQALRNYVKTIKFCCEISDIPVACERRN